MKATISELWETGRQIITFDNSDTERPQSVSDLKKCENILIGEKLPYGIVEVLIDNSIVMVSKGTARHPYGGTIHFLEIL